MKAARDAACASYQCEGVWDAYGKAASIWDNFTHDKGKDHVLNDETGDVACDTYRPFGEDTDLMQKLNLGVYRFSISWPRVLPEGTGKMNEAGLAYYDRLIGAPEKGYLQWSFLDNFEWAKGYSDRFDMVYVDYPVQKCILKDSALRFAKVIKHNRNNL